MKWLTMVMLLPTLALAGGCVSAKDAVTDGDRAVIHQTEEAGKRILANSKDTETQKLAEDVQKNMAQLATNFGPPKDPATLQPYSPEQSEKDRQRSKKEHEDAGNKWAWLTGVGGAVLLAAGWFLRSYGLGSIPIVGPLLASLSARLGNGAVANEKIAAGAMTVIDKIRDKLDKKETVTGPDVVAMVRGTMGDAGILKENTALYDATDTGVPEAPTKS